MASSLDDLLKSIRDEAKRESALVVTDGKSDGKSDEQLVDEEIDERVLRLLGLEDTVDIDYATYRTLLKEALVKYSVVGKDKIPTEEIEALRENFQKVKRKTGRFKVKKKKISVANIRKTSPLKRLGAVKEDPQKLLAPAKEEEELGPIDTIIKSLSSIVQILQERNSLLKKQREKNRKLAQNKARGDKESKFESSGLQKLMKGAQKVIAPVQSLLSKLFEIFTKIILGRFLVKFIDWFSDKENQGKVDAIIQFLSDHWPKLLVAYLLFGNSLGRFVTRITVMLVKGAATLLTKVLPSLLKFVATNPFAAGAVLFGAGAIVPKLFPQTVEDDADKQANEAAKEKGNEQAAADIRNQKGGMFDFLTGAGQERKEQAQRLETGEEKRYGFFGELAGGGQVSGPSGTDVIPARLTDGEFVMSKGAVDTFGTDFMEGINAAGGGNNRPKMSSGTIYAAGGGQIGEKRKETVPGGYRKDYNVNVSNQVNPKVSVSNQINPVANMSADKVMGDSSTAKTLTREQQLGKTAATPEQLSATATKRHAELMKSTSPQKIADYDAKHGAGAYSKKLQEKLNKIYSTALPSGAAVPKTMPKPTGKVVGRENLPASTVKVLEKMDAQKAGKVAPDVKTTGPLLGRLVMGSGLFPSLAGLPGMGGGGGGTNALTNQAKVRSIPGMLGDLFNAFKEKKIDPQTILEGVESKAKNLVTSMGGTIVDSNSQEQNMKRVMSLPPELRKAVLDDMERSKKTAQLSSNQPQPKVSAPQPPMQRPPQQIINQMSMNEEGGSSYQAQDNSLPNIEASSGSASSKRFMGMMGIQA